MAAVPYIGPGSGLTHEHLNALYTEANARLKKAYGGVCPALWGAGEYVGGPTGITMPFRMFTKKFFFFDSVPTTPYTTFAEYFIGKLAVGVASGSGEPLPGWSPGDASWFRRYDHTPFTSYVTGATISLDGGAQSVDTGYPCVRLDPPTTPSTTQAAIWPDRSPAPYPEGLLAYSLEAHKKTVTVSGVDTDCFCYVNDLGAGPSVCNDQEAEHIDVTTPIEVFLGRGVGGSFTWAANYNKYGFIRFNNLQTVDVTLTTYTIDGSPDPGFSPTVPAMGSLCIRRVPGANGWALGLDYFFLMFKDDPWFLKNPNELMSNTTNALLAATIVPHLGDDYYVRGLTDSTQWWDFAGSGLAYPFGAAESNSTLLGDVVIQSGKLLKVYYDSGTGDTTKTWIDFNSFSVLTAALAAAGITLTNNSTSDPTGSNKGFNLSASGPSFELIDYSSNLLHAGGYAGGSGKVGVLSLGTSIAPFEWPALQVPNALACCEIATISNSQTWANTVTWNNKVWKRSAPFTASIYKGYFETVGSLVTDLQALLPSADVTTAITTKRSINGPWLDINETFGKIWPADNFDWTTDLTKELAFGLSVSAWRILNPRIILNGDGTLSRKVGVPMFVATITDATSPAWAIHGSMAGYNGTYAPEYCAPLWPRIDRPWTSLRFYIHPGNEPWLTNGSGTFQTKVPPDSELPFLKSYYENKPFVDWNTPTERLNPYNGSHSPAPGVFKKLGIRILDYFNPAPDFYGSLSAWINRGKMQFQAYDGTPNAGYSFNTTDLSSDAAQHDYYITAQGSIQHASATTYDGGQNLLPMLTEHFNAAAQAVNGTIALRGGPYLSPLIQIYGTGIDYSLLPSRTIGGFGTSQLRPRTEYASWDNSVAPSLTTAWSNLGITVRTSADFPIGFSDLSNAQQWYGPSGGPGTVADWWMAFMTGAAVTNYRWVSIGDVQAFCTANKIPFQMAELVVPCSITYVDTTGGSSATTYPKNAVWYVCDTNGAWVFNPDVGGANPGTWILRADVSRTDVCDTPVGVLDFSPLDQRFYYGTIYGTGPQSPSYPVTPTQFILGNSCYLYRNWGFPACSAMIWPRNYADVQPRNIDAPWSTRSTGSYTLVAVTTLEDPANPVNINSLPSDSETIITTTIENAVLQVWPADLPLT